jgi:xylulokinase
MKYFLGLDIGTSGAKALLCDDQGQIINIAMADYPLYTPFPLWSEQDPEDWWGGACQAIQEVVSGASIPPAEIAAIGLTGQMHGAVFLDQNDQVIRRALLWNDQRTAAECEQITEIIGMNA